LCSDGGSESVEEEDEEDVKGVEEDDKSTESVPLWS